jgi:hypothetical protein
MRHVDRNRFVLKGADKERVLAPIPTNPMMDYTSREYVIPLSRGHLPPCDHIKLEGIMLSRRASNKKKEEAPTPLFPLIKQAIFLAGFGYDTPIFAQGSRNVCP